MTSCTKLGRACDNIYIEVTVPYCLSKIISTFVFFSRMDVRNNMLIFHQIEVDDAGEYQCTARSRHANATAIAEVIVSGM